MANHWTRPSTWLVVPLGGFMLLNTTVTAWLLFTRAAKEARS